MLLWQALKRRAIKNENGVEPYLFTCAGGASFTTLVACLVNHDISYQEFHNTF